MGARRKLFRILSVAAILGLKFVPAPLHAQTVQPLIAEYKAHGEGRFEVTNNSLTPMVVLLEPRSFTITPEGKGIYRELDSTIHVDLSTSSLKLAPHQTAYVFYKADSEMLPAWFTIYATFSSPVHTAGLDMRIMLPHTVYLYQEYPLAEKDVTVSDVTYHAATGKLEVSLENDGYSLGRVQEVHGIGGHGEAEGAGFPLLPHGKRELELAWNGKEPPSELSFRFDHFTLKRPVSRQ
ncbi:hypothetical protein SAMN05421770_101513 [Granulicella rosea]|uniref:Uncharacterized protein n=1 Tax=Granulicella rosea TaxID=474952 RepID=A0A239DLL7_9BACT|nr:hypothetical protein [Granulicella rosea]SNS32722.1 hypothetical protein SAMN05421770_101513 [Granulicella rosea]